MAQAGIHGLVGAAVKKGSPARKWLLLGLVLGNIVPDLDNLAVAAATLTGGSTEGLHRTLTHSLFFVVAIIIVFYIISWAVKKPKWGNLGLGLGIGVLMHILLDLLVWFNGLEILWPLPSWVNLWENVTPPEWWDNLMLPIEFLFFALFFMYLGSRARQHGTDSSFLGKLKVWINIQWVLFVIFLVLVYTWSGFMIPYGGLYLVSLGLAFGIVIRMRATIESTV